MSILEYHIDHDPADDATTVTITENKTTQVIQGNAATTGTTALTTVFKAADLVILPPDTPTGMCAPRPGRPASDCNGTAPGTSSTPPVIRAGTRLMLPGWRLRNNGNLDTVSRNPDDPAPGYFTTGFYFATSLSMLDTTTVTKFGTRIQQSPVAAGAEVAFDGQSAGVPVFEIPPNTPAGTYYIIVNADDRRRPNPDDPSHALDDIVEGREDNNATALAVTVITGADVVVPQVSVAAPLTENGQQTSPSRTLTVSPRNTVSVSYATQNIGPGDTLVGFTNAFALQSTTQPASAPILLVTSSNTPAIDPNPALAHETGRFPPSGLTTVSMIVPPNTPPDYYALVVMGDSTNVITPEVSETNNTNSVPLRVVVTLTAANDVAATDEDTSVVIPVLANDPNPSANGDPLAVLSVTVPSHGTAAINPDNTITYAPASNYNGTDSFSYTSTDHFGQTATATVSVTVRAVNDPPTADAQSTTLDEDTSKAITLTGTDLETASTNLTFAIATPPAYGVLTGAPPNVAYTPNHDYNGLDSFTFTVKDRGDPDNCASLPPFTQGCAPALISTPAIVNITVKPVNDPPSATPQSVSTDEDTPLAVTLSGTDVETTDPANLTYAIVNSPAHGNLSVSGRTRTYSPATNYNGTDSFTFTVTDRGDPDGCSGALPGCSPALTSAPVTVTIDVKPVNDPPVAVNDYLTTREDTPLVARNLALENGPTCVAAPSGLVAWWRADGDASDRAGGHDGTLAGGVAFGAGEVGGAFTFNGVDGLVSVPASNDLNLRTALTIGAWVKPDHYPAPDAAVIAGRSHGYQLLLLTDGRVRFLFPFGGAGGQFVDSAAPIQTTKFTHVAATYDVATGLGNIYVDGTLAGTAALQGPIDDMTTPFQIGGFSDVVGVFFAGTIDEVELVNRALPASEIQAIVNAGPAGMCNGLLTNDSDVETPPLNLIASIVTPPSHAASFSLSPDGSFTYMPEADYNGPDSFTYNVTDAGDPTGCNPTGTAPCSIAKASEPATVFIHITEVNDPPVAFDDAKSTNEDVALSFPASDLAANDSKGAANESAQTLTVSGVAATANTHGTVSLSGGNVVYVPAQDYNGPASFTYTVTDDGTTNGAPDPKSAVGTVNVTVTPVNDPPSFTKGADQSVMSTAGAQTVTPWATAIQAGPPDEANQTLNFVVSNDNNSLFDLQPAIDPAGTLTYTPRVGTAGAATVTVQLHDNGGGADASAPQTFTITVNPSGPTTFVVTNTNDSGPGSLRGAIANANANPSSDTITFNIAGPGVQRISPLSPLPAITDTTTIDATTQPGYGGTPLVELSGGSAGPGVSGLALSAAGNNVRGLAIGGFGGYGVSITGPGSNRFERNHIGVAADGSTPRPNASGGILVTSSPGNIIGSPSGSNVISGNGGVGVTIVGVNGNGADNNVVQNNFIGTNAAGTAALGNTAEGLLLTANNTVVGGTAPGTRNVISGNASNGIRILNAGTNNSVQGNYIGTNAAGTAAIGNGGSGVVIEQTGRHTIGGTAPGAGNLISGNAVHGIFFFVCDPGLAGCSSGNVVQGNLIGTMADGVHSLGNGVNGIRVGAAPNNRIGGTTAAARNVISGNTGDGLHLREAWTTGTIVQGNFIGLGIDGVTAVPNGTGPPGTFPLENYGAGIYLVSASNTIGGSAPGAGNVIGFNTLDGIDIDVGGIGNTISGNLIGTQASGMAGAPNGRNGVTLANSPTNNTLSGNVISANLSNGVQFFNASTNTVQQNNIGRTIDGNGHLGNAANGIVVASSSGNQLLQNQMAFNGGAGVRIDSGTGNRISSNAIDNNGGLGIDLFPFGVTANDPGDADTGANNLQNFPVLTKAVSTASTTSVAGTLNSTANTTFALEFFSSASCDPSGNGEGELYLGGASLTTDATGNAAFFYSFAGGTLGRQLTATATDPNGNTSEFSACQAVAANQAPTATSFSLSTPKSRSVPVNLSGIDPDGFPVTYAFGIASHGALTGVAPSLTYAPNPGYTGSDAFTYTVNDGALTSVAATVSITVTDTAPVAYDVSVTTNENTAASVTLSASDADGDSLTYAIVASPAHGVLSGTAPNLTFTPAANFVGTDTFTYRANDGQLDSNTATVTITVNAVQDRRAIVARFGTNTIRVLDLERLSIQSTINLGADALDVAVTPDGRMGVATDFYGKKLTFVDLTTNPPAVTAAIATPIYSEDVDVSTSPAGFAVSADGGGSVNVYSVNLATRQIVTTLALPFDAEGITIVPNSGGVVLANAIYQHVVRVLHLAADGALTDTGVSVSTGGTYPINVTPSPDGRLALVANGGSGSVGVLRIASNGIVSLDSVLSGFGPVQSVAFLSDGSKAYVSDVSGKIAILNVNAGYVVDTGVRLNVTTSSISYFGVDQIAAGTNRLVVHGAGVVTIIDTITNTVLGTITIPNDARVGGIAMIPR